MTSTMTGTVVGVEDIWAVADGDDRGAEVVLCRCYSDKFVVRLNRVLYFLKHANVRNSVAKK